MPRLTAHLLALATLSAAATVLSAQAPAPAATNIPSPPAPIERPAAPNGSGSYQRHAQTMATLAAGQPFITTNNTATARPTPGILVRIGEQSSLTAISLDYHHTELRLDRGLLNLNVHRASNDELVLVDLPGGQSHPLKDGLYTFNANTDTVRVFKGEAEAFPAITPNGKALKLEEDHAVTFAGLKIRSVDFEPFQAAADLIPYTVEPGYGRVNRYVASGSYGPGYGPYGDGFYGDSPYGVEGYPYGYGGYPFGIGLGFGYYGGFGVFRGVYGGFHGHR